MRAWVVASLVGVFLIQTGCSTAGRQLPGLFPWQREPLDRLAKQAESADPDRRREAALALGHKRFRGEQAEQVRELLTTLLRSDLEPLVRSAAAVSLGRLGGEPAVAALSEGLSDASGMVRADVCRGLGTTGAAAAVGPLTRTLAEDTSVDVRCAAARGLGNSQEPEARRALVAALDAERAAVRTAAWQALRRSTGAKKLPPERAAWEKWLADEKGGGAPKRKRFLFW